MAEFVPPEFEMPLGLETSNFVLEPLGPEHNEQERENRSQLDAPVWRAVSEWLASDWPFDRVEYAPRA